MTHYKIVHLTPETNMETATSEHVAYMVSLSGGLGSAIAAEWAIARYGRAQVGLWFSDVQDEDEDTYRFLHDLLARWGGTLYWYTDGRRPADVWDERKLIPNSLIAPCTYTLKIEPYRKFIRAMPQLPVVLIGFKQHETRRQTNCIASYKEAIPEALVEYPLLWRPEETRELTMICRQDLDIEPPRVYDLGYEYNNCFAGETRFLTGEGTKTFHEMVGQEPLVMTTRGEWVKASIQSFGKQCLWKLVLRKNSHEKIIYATAEHRWFAHRGYKGHTRVEVMTSQLKPGTHLVSLFGRSVARVRPSAFGIAHGIVYGDGTRFSGRQQPAHVVLCGEKNAELLRYFPLSPMKEMAGVGIRVDDLPRSFKDRPSLSESKSYLYGWLAGYFAADGNVNKDGSLSIYSASYESLLFVRDVCIKLGIGTMPISTQTRTGYGSKPTPLYYVRLQRNTLTEDFFILSQHRQRALAFGFHPTQKPADWVVVSVEPTDRIEEVYCTVVPETHCFVLEDNILTGNCLGAGGCCRSGITTWVRTAYFFPERFAQRESWEQQARAQGGARANRSFCARTRNGTKGPLTLEQIRLEYLPNAHKLLKLSIGKEASKQ